MPTTGWSPTSRRSWARPPATRSIRQDLLTTAIEGLDEVARGTERRRPDLDRAVAHQKLGEILRQIGRADEARRQFEQSLRLAEDLAAGSDRRPRASRNACATPASDSAS